MNKTAQHHADSRLFESMTAREYKKSTGVSNDFYENIYQLWASAVRNNLTTQQ